jgi:hypothetical protein
MFMIVSYPWPVASAHVQLSGLGRQAPGRKPQDQDQPVTEPDQRRTLLASKA